ncbi:aspartate aminotransferase family protein [Paracoccus versutus]|uniref:4-aminobutyrate aminotransferase-like enzyme n=1 Tax=Paracoccus versutus TaxID=34007 RepID=A0A3D9Y2H7_PARVE|nr:aminotransferase class III-fold pyridoxal phosphate-dependent enzyme [Paracoccus versutus]REF73389.1 4-aminobutyrate aminotransferase-like enzyme [Paracoccus versutus]WGR54591.1 aminotransferase class III-fold pyridoxal phosphate-dependent enzyme [Paracoccus versutus]
MGKQPASSRTILDLNTFRNAPGALSDAARRRIDNVGASAVLFYRDPVQMISAEGAWMTGSDGRRYLDVYNNVPAVGHSHPEIVEAVARQMAVLNTHSRYIVESVDAYMEALKATMPAGLDNIVLTCTGSEANDLAMRIAEVVTGGKGYIVTENAYHGNTGLVCTVSPSSMRSTTPPDNIVIVPAPLSRNYPEGVGAGFTQAVQRAIETLESRGIAPAALLYDSIFSSDGVCPCVPGEIATAIQAARAAGALFIADEVQPGFARTGDAFWGVQRHGVSPDIMTMGKPMGNGFPMGGLAVRSDYLTRFCDQSGYFNTFAGNPVAAAAGHATLRILQRERLQEHASCVGAHVKERLLSLATRNPRLGEVRGAGFFVGVDIISPDDPTKLDPGFAVELVNRLRDRCVLIGMAGKESATLRFRPPLVMTAAESDLFVEALEDAILDS